MLEEGKTVRFVLLASFVFLSGCAATGAPFVAPADPPAGEAVVYVYRLNNQAFRNVYPKVHINGEDRGALKNQGFLLFRLPPGLAEITVKGDGMIWPKSSVAIRPSLSANSVHFIRYSIAWKFGTLQDVGSFILESVPREEALKELTTTRMSE